MSQYDAGAMPLYECFTSKADVTPYKLKPAEVDLERRNIATTKAVSVLNYSTLLKKMQYLILISMRWFGNR
jgi:hypothetical protein